MPDQPFLPLTSAIRVDPAWSLTEDGFTLAREREIESIMAVSNGYVGVRGSLSERTSLSAPATFLAGLFEVGTGSAGMLEPVVLPDWTWMRVLVEGMPLSLETGEILEHRRILDLQHGILYRVWRHRDEAGRVTALEFARLVSLCDRHLFLQRVAITPENYSGMIALDSALEKPDTTTAWRPRIEDATALMVGATTRGATVAVAYHSEIRHGLEHRPDTEAGVRVEGIADRWQWRAGMGQTARFDRWVVGYSSREAREPVGAAAKQLRRAIEVTPDIHMARQAAAWEAQWHAAGPTVVGDHEAQLALRFAVYHLTSAVNPTDEHASVGARGLTGSVYKGHAFWDTEIYLVPFYAWTEPAAARALLMYRFHRLPAARERARKFGYRGALYPWESADTGEDVTPDSMVGPDGREVRVLTGVQEHHISADIAYAVWQYWQTTADERFMLDAGVDILIETARFWATRGRVETDGRYHIRTVIGPDEYHEGVDDNAFTNVMAQWNLEQAADLVDWLRADRPDAWEAIARRVDVQADETETWRRIAKAMYTGFDPSTGLFEEFAGFFTLDELDLEREQARTLPLELVLGRERLQRTKVVKQADVVALSVLLWDRFPHAVHEANFRYYEPRTAHGSSLSPSFHALVSARLGDVELATRYFQETAAIDLAKGTGNAAGGVHIAALGGLWQAAVFGMAGIRHRDAGLMLDPHLPPAWEAFSVPLQWRGRTFCVSITRKPDEVAVELRSGDPMTVELQQGSRVEIDSAQRYVARKNEAGWDVWRRSAASKIE
jgi:kojibiose phosphorylase